jgi:hypothetical protein
VRLRQQHFEAIFLEMYICGDLVRIMSPRECRKGHRQQNRGDTQPTAKNHKQARAEDRMSHL